MATVVKIIGLARLQAKLNQIPKSTQRLMRSALAQGADEIVAFMKRLVPVKSGTLRNSIGWRWGGTAPRGSMAVFTGQAGGLTLTIYAGNDKAFYARMVEFGTVNMTPKPYFFPAYRAIRRKVKADIRGAARFAIQMEARK